MGMDAGDVKEKLRAAEARIQRLEVTLSCIVDHWREFGSMMVNNATNRDDFGLDKRIEAAAKLIRK